MRRAISILLPALLAAPDVARAGDPEAHTVATDAITDVVASDPAFVNGVGAPVKNGRPAPGRFPIPNPTVMPCPFTLPRPKFNVGCAYASFAAITVNEPDDWACIDPRAPDRMNMINSFTAPFQAMLATRLAAGRPELATACNWNHFTTNPALPAHWNNDTSAGYDITAEWANKLVDGIEKNGANADGACDLQTFTVYLKRVYYSLHYVQDQVCEHHDLGNKICTFTDVIPLFNSNPVLNYQRLHDCMTWIVDIIPKVTGPNPVYGCDSAVVDAPTAAGVDLNTNMYDVLKYCGISLSGRLAFNLRLPLSLACAGFERTVRHHCLLDVPKTIKCFGPESDHQNVTPQGTWCEGEVYSGGGQDFITPAKAASEPIFRKAMQRWGDVCKEPDDPCSATQCNNWCERTQGQNTGGFCVNAAPDPQCLLHECKCLHRTACGQPGAPCCTGTAPCTGTNVCIASTGTCGPMTMQTCMAPVAETGRFFVNSDVTDNGQMLSVQAWIAFPKVPGGMRYQVHIHGFNDPAFYHTDATFAFNGTSGVLAAGQVIEDHGSEVWVGLAGQTGHCAEAGCAATMAPGLAAYYQRRFAGIIVDVLVFLQ